MSSVFGLNECNDLVHVSEVARGLQCQCRCVQCNEPLVARKGEVRDHHFAHASNLEACDSSFESLLHRYAKQLVVQARGLLAPVTAPVADFLAWDAGDAQRLLHVLGDVQEEVSLGGIRPDLLVVTDDGVQVAIEVAYSSFCDTDKALQFEQLGLPALEIDLSQFKPEGFDPLAVRHAVIHSIEHKHWVWPNTVAPITHQVTKDLPTPCVEVPPTPSKRLPEDIINFDGRWVSVRLFPSGDIAIKAVSYDPDLISIIKQVAKSHGGEFNPRYKTWNVPRWAARLARTELLYKSKTLRIGIRRTSAD